jgi:hypothetical protein
MDKMNEHTNIVNVLNDLSLNSLKDESQRSKALLAAYALVARLETPWETTARLCMGQVRISIRESGF